MLLKNISCQHRPRQSGNYAVAVNLKLALVGYTTPLKGLLMMIMVMMMMMMTMIAIVQCQLLEIGTCQLYVAVEGVLLARMMKNMP